MNSVWTWLDHWYCGLFSMYRDGSWNPHTNWSGFTVMRRWTPEGFDYRQPTISELEDSVDSRAW